MSSGAFPKLFLADQCPHSHQLWRTYGKQLSQCPTIYVYNRHDKNHKRRSETLLAIRYNSIRQFPTLLFADGSRLTSKRQIEKDLMESIEVLNDKPLIPRYQDAPNDSNAVNPNGPIDPQATIDLSDRHVQQSMIGDWPSADDGQMIQPQQQMPNYFPQGNNTPDQQQQVPDVVQAQSQPPQIRPMNENDAMPSNGQKLGIGTSADVDTSAAGAGSTTMMASTNAPMCNDENEDIGSWPTSGKVNGLTGRGNRNIESFLSNKSAQNANMQNIRMNLGQTVAEPVPRF